MTLAGIGHRTPGGNGYTTGMSELAFFKSSHSSRSENCVEVADLPTGAVIRDSRNPHEGHLDVPHREWTAFLDTTRR